MKNLLDIIMGQDILLITYISIVPPQITSVYLVIPMIQKLIVWDFLIVLYQEATL